MNIMLRFLGCSDEEGEKGVPTLRLLQSCGQIAKKMFTCGFTGWLMYGFSVPMAASTMATAMIMEIFAAYENDMYNKASVAFLATKVIQCALSTATGVDAAPLSTLLD